MEKKPTCEALHRINFKTVGEDELLAHFEGHMDNIEKRLYYLNHYKNHLARRREIIKEDIKAVIKSRIGR